MESRPSKVSVCLVSYKREEELLEIIANLAQYDWIDELIVHRNTEDSNVGVFGRYLSAAVAQNEIIYTQDDDIIVNCIEQIRDMWDGEHICNMTKPSHPEGDLLGWGAFFKKEWVGVLDEYIARYGEDEVLYQQADRIFSALQRKKFNTLESSDWYEYPSASDPDVAMYLQKQYCENLATAKRRINEMLLTN